MSEVKSMPVPGVARQAECCGTCNAFLPMPNNARIGRCIARPPQVVATQTEIMALPTGGTLMVAKQFDGAFPLTTVDLRCRDGYQPKVILDLNIETPTEGGEQ